MEFHTPHPLCKCPSPLQCPPPHNLMPLASQVTVHRPGPAQAPSRLGTQNPRLPQLGPWAEHQAASACEIRSKLSPKLATDPVFSLCSPTVCFPQS